MLNSIVDDMAMGENSNYNIAVKNYVDNGYSEAEAKKLAFTDIYIKETAMSIVGGAISGGFFGGFGGATGAIRGLNTINRVDKINKAYDNTVKNLQGFFEGNTEKSSNSNVSYAINPEGHSPQMQRTIQEYNNAVDTDMFGFIENARKNKNDNKSTYELSDVSDRLATDVEKITGINTSGFENVIKANAIRHIDEGHGINGSTDSTMSDDSDIARMQYVIDNYDSIELLPEASKEYRDKNNSPAPMVRLSKRINGTYYVVEAVPDSTRHQLAVVTAYKNKAVEHQEVDASPLPNVQNDPNVTALSDNNIAQKASVVNNQYMQDDAYDTYLQSNVDFLDRLKEKTGIDYEVMTENFKDADGNDDMSIEAMYDRSKNKMYFAKHVSGSSALKYVVAHEVTHFIEGTDEYNQYKEFVIKELFGGDTDAFKAAVQAKIDLYYSHGVTLDTNGAESEIVADFTKDFLYDENSINRLAQEKPNVFRRIYDFIVELISKFRNGSDSQEISTFEQARKVFEKAMRKAAANSNTNTSIQNKINANFYTEVDKWYNSGMKYATSIFVGRTSSPLQSIGVKDTYIKWDTSKIEKVLSDHPEMNIDVIKQVPNVIEKPVLIMESITQPGRLVAFGEVYDAKQNPVLVALELNPSSRSFAEIDGIKIAGSYGKSGVQHLIDSSDIYYIDPNKKRTDTWLMLNRLQLPLDQTKYGSIKKIPQNFYSVNNKSITEPQNYSYSVTDNIDVNSQSRLDEVIRLNRTGIVKNIDNSDGFMSLETVRTEDGKVLNVLNFDRHNFETIKESEAKESNRSNEVNAFV